MAALVAWVHPAAATQIPTTPSGSWDGADPVAFKDTPGDLRVTIEASPPLAVAQRNNSALQTNGTTNAPTLPSDTNGLQLQADLGLCEAAFSGVPSCNTGTLGALILRFATAAGEPVAVRDPVLHIARVGSSLGAGTRAAVALQATTPGLVFTADPGASNLTVAGGTRIDVNLAGVGAAADCPQAGCGSIVVNGTTAEIRFAVGAERSDVAGSWNPGTDAFFLTVSVDEDLGDAPATYDGTNPAAHIVSSLAIGADVSVDDRDTINGGATGSSRRTSSPLASPGALADADDGTPSFAPITDAMAGRPYSVAVPYSGALRPATMCGWIDLNRNDVFDLRERACATTGTGTGLATLAFTVPPDVEAGATTARFRLGYSAAQVGTPRGLADSGEVEDVAVTIDAAPSRPQITADLRAQLVIDADGSGQVSPGDTLEYRSVVINRGAVEATGVVFTNTVDRNAALVAVATTLGQGRVTEGSGGGPRVGVALGSLAPGASTSVVFRTRIVRPARRGITRIVNQAVVTANAVAAVVTDDPETPAPNDANIIAISGRTRLAVAQLRSATGDNLRLYRLRLTNTGSNLATGIVITEVLPREMSFVGRPGGGTVRGRVLTLRVATLAPGRSVTIRVRVRGSLPAPVATATATSSNAATVLTRRRIVTRPAPN